jgi:PAS domain S-box-containing protein
MVAVEADARYRSLFENSYDAILLTNLDGTILAANPAACRLFGMTEEELVKAGRAGIVIEDEELELALRERERLGKSKGEITYRRKDGTILIGETTSSHFTDVDGIGKTSMTIRDITRRKQEEGELERTKAHLEAILNQMPVGITVIEPPDCRIIYQNKEVERIFRHELFPKEGMEEAEKWQFFDPDGTPINVEEDIIGRSLLEGVVIKDHLEKILRGDGTYGYLRTTSTPIHDRHGNIIAAIAMNIDVTEQFEAQKMISELVTLNKEEVSRLQTILDNIPLGIFIADAAGRPIILNRVFDELWGGSPYLAPGTEKAFITGRNAITGKAIEDKDWPMSRALRGEASSLVADMQRYDGKRVTMTIAASPLVDPRDTLSGAIMVSQDITEMRDLQEALSKHAAALTRSNAELQQFAYVASHDLQEPLRMVTSYIGLLNKKYGNELNAQAKEYMAYAVDGADRMRSLINDLLQYSRIETQGKPFSAVDLERVVKEVIDTLHVAIAENKALVTVEPLPMIWGDATQLSQVFQNLISNAIKFRGPEAPRIVIGSRETAEEWTMWVSDNGIGIEPKYHDRLFQMFQRLHTRAEYEGTGIGLAIAKKIVERHGGRIWLVSDGRNGATFYIAIPKPGR